VFFVAVLLFPVLLLGLLLAMERVERPLTHAQAAVDLARALDGAAVLSAEEVEAAATAGYAAVLERYWRGRRSAARQAEAEQP
jgi:hypothetical protein